MTDIDSTNWHSHGDTGSAFSDGFNYSGGERVNEKHLDYLVDQQKKDKDDIIAAIERRVTDINGDLVLSGLVASKGTNALETDVSASDGAYVAGQYTGTITATTITHSTNGTTSTRTDVIYVKENGGIAKTEGSTSAPSGTHKLAEVDVSSSDSISAIRKYGHDLVDLVASEQPPSSPSEPDIWYDYPNGQWKFYDGSQWEALGGGVDTVTVASNYTTDGEEIIYVDTSSAAVTVTLASADLKDGREVTVTDVAGNAATNNITIDTGGTETIDGSNSISIKDEYGTIVVASDGSNWYTSGGGTSFWTDADQDGLLETTKSGVQVDRVLGKGISNKQTVASGDTVLVPSDHSCVVVGPYQLDGQVQIDGTMKIL